MVLEIKFLLENYLSRFGPCPASAAIASSRRNLHCTVPTPNLRSLSLASTPAGLIRENRMNDNHQVRVPLPDAAFDERTRFFDSTNKFQNPCQDILVWLHWMAPLLGVTLYWSFGLLPRPKVMAAAGGNPRTRRNVTKFMLLLTIVTFVLEPPGTNSNRIGK
jgi:hypothetical protein